MSLCISGIKNGGNLPENMLRLQPTGVVVGVAVPFLARLPVFPDNVLDSSFSTCLFHVCCSFLSPSATETQLAPKTLCMYGLNKKCYLMFYVGFS